MKRHPKYEDYSITEDGKVYSHLSGRFLKSRINKYGYEQLSLKGKTALVHRLVAEVYLPNIDKNLQVNHIDGCKTNNNKSNLEWCTAKQNINHSWETGLSKPLYGEDNPSTTITESIVHLICVMLQDGLRANDISKHLGVSKPIVLGIRDNKTWKSISSGYVFNVNRKYRRSIDTILKAANLLEQGLSNKQVCHQTGLHSYEVTRIRKKEFHRYILKDFNFPKSPYKKLYENDIIKICNLLQSGSSSKEIVKETGVSYTQLRSIKTRRTWKHISSKYFW